MAYATHNIRVFDEATRLRWIEHLRVAGCRQFLVQPDGIVVLSVYDNWREAAGWLEANDVRFDDLTTRTSYQGAKPIPPIPPIPPVTPEDPAPEPETAATVTCPDCDGTGRSECLVDGSDRKTGRRYGGSRVLDCFLCRGTGSIPQDYADQIAAGAALREARQKRGIGLVSEAQSRGMTPRDYSNLERGRVGKYAPSPPASAERSDR